MQPRNTKPTGTAFFADFQFDLLHLELRKHGIRVRLERKPAQVLAFLLSQPGTLVTRLDLRQSLWPDDVHLDFEHALNKSIHKLRAVLSEDAADPRLIERISGQGYRFIGSVRFASPLPEVVERDQTDPLGQDQLETSTPSLSVARSVLSAPASNTSAIVSTADSSPRFAFLRARLAGFALAGICAVVTVLAVGIHLRNPLRHLWGSRAGRPSLAIVGFRNLSNDPGESWLSTALAEWLSTDLNSNGQVRLVSDSELTRAKNKLGITGAKLSVDELSRLREQLHADVVVSGSYAVVSSDATSQIRLDLCIQTFANDDSPKTASLVGSRDQLLEMAGQAGSAVRAALQLPRLNASGIEGVRAALPENPIAAKLYAEGLDELRALNAAEAQQLLDHAAQVEPLHALTHFALAQAWTRLGYGSKAQAEAKQALELATSLPIEQKLLIRGQYHEAVQDWNSAVEDYASLFRFHADEIEYGLRLANAQIAASRPSASMETLASLRNLAPPFRNDPRIDLTEAEAAQAVSDFTRQAKLAAVAAEKGEKQHMPLLVAQARLAEGEAKYTLGDMQGALDLWNAGQKSFEAAGDKSRLACILNRQAWVFWKMNKVDDAVRRFEVAIDLSRTIQDQANLAAGLAGLGNILLYHDQPDRAHTMLTEAVDIYSKTGNVKEQAYAISLLGDLDMLYNHLPQARELYEQSLVLSRQVGDRSRVAGRLMDLGISDTILGNLSSASEKLNESLRIYRELGEKIRVSHVVHRLARVEILQGNLVKAAQDIEEAIRLRKEVGEHSVWQARNDLAGVYLEMHRPADAEAAARQALYERNFNSEPVSWIVLARILFAEGKTADSENAYHHALNYPPHYLGGEFEVDLCLYHAALLASQRHFATAEREVAKAGYVARKFGSVTEEMKVRLARGQVELQAGEKDKGISTLVAFQRDAHGLGFGLFAAQAQAALASRVSAPIASRSVQDANAHHRFSY